MKDYPNFTLIRGAEDASLMGLAELEKLMYFGRLNNVKVINAKANPFDNKFNLDYTRDEPIGTSSLGTPVYTDLTLLGLSYTNNKTGKVVNLPNDRYRTGGANNSVAGNDTGIGAAFYMNIETVLITVNQAANIVKTKIQGLDGTVKEYIGLDDASIVINGIITGKNGVYPMKEVNRLRAWLAAPVSKGVVSRWLGNLGVDNIVVDSFSIPQVEGAYSYQMFSIQASGDLPVELEINVPIN